MFSFYKKRDWKHGELETILGSKKVEKKLNIGIGRYRIKYFFLKCR